MLILGNLLTILMLGLVLVRVLVTSVVGHHSGRHLRRVSIHFLIVNGGGGDRCGLGAWH